MDSTITRLQNSAPQYPKHPISAAAKKVGSGFDSFVEKAVKKMTVDRGSNNPPVDAQSVFVGQITKEAPSVSEVMIKNGNFGNRSWEIIYSPVNREKPYTKIPEGTKIFLDPQSKELFWGQNEAVAAAQKSVVSEPLYQNAEKGVLLGTLNGEAPTISHLLASSDTFSKQKWEILALPVNVNKDFTHIPVGAIVRIDPETKEIHWQTGQKVSGVTPQNMVAASPYVNKQFFSPDAVVSGDQVDLSKAVQEFIGTPYSQIDCYSLVVKGLKNVGVQYGGTDGLYRRLTDMAKAKGLPSNAYLTGEGLVEAIGSRVLYEAYPVVKSPDIAARESLEKMARVMERGQILSFSTPTRGHTGIISQQGNGDWTFINSGRMDNPVNIVQSKKEVGEEDLLAELTNWFNLARRRKESLTLTLGRVELAKLQPFQTPSSSSLLASL